MEYYYVHGLYSSAKETNPEKITRLWLEDNNIQYEEQYKIDYYYADFYIPQLNMVLEVYGDYWHCNPKFYGNGLREINDIQKKSIVRDKIRTNYLIKKGYKVNIIWEDDVYNRIDEVLKLLF